MSEKTVTVSIPEGYKLVLVPSESPAPNAPDYQECARQATETTGMPNLYGNPWLNIFCREVNRWCVQRSADDEHASENNDSITLRAKFESWATDAERCGMLSIERNEDGHYKDQLTIVAWESCKATAGIMHRAHDPEPLARIVLGETREDGQCDVNLEYNSKHAVQRLINLRPTSGEVIISLFPAASQVDSKANLSNRDNFEAQAAAMYPSSWMLYKLGEMPTHFNEKIDNIWLGWQWAMHSLPSRQDLFIKDNLA